MRARSYDPNVGRFISEDPLGFAGGDVNLSTYVQNNPVNMIDPEGTDTTAAGGVIGGVIGGPPGAAIGAATGAIIGGVIGAIIVHHWANKPCDDGGKKCRQLEKKCVGAAKNVESHVFGGHMYPGPCKNLNLVISEAKNAGCGDSPGVQWATSVYNVHCARDWSGQYPNNTPNFPPF